MAGIGFELRRMMRKNTVAGMVQTYAYAGLVGSGPWVISIVAILAIGLFAGHGSGRSLAVEQFQVSLSYLMAFSLILTSPLQLLFTRWAADRLFEHRDDLILQNLFGALALTMAVSCCAAAWVLLLYFDGSLVYRLSMLAAFVLLCCIWMVQIFASAIKAYRQILLVFVLGYGITVGAALAMQRFGLVGLMSGFVIGQAILLFTLLAQVVRQFPGPQGVDFQFLRRAQIFPELALTGLLYNLGVWVDKFVFWNDSLTGVQVVGPLRASPVYDIPIFLAYLSIIPGMAVFLIRMEVDVAECCARFYKEVTGGGTLARVTAAKQALIIAVKGGMVEMLKVQFLTTAVLVLMATEVLRLFGISPLYRSLFCVNLAAVALQLIVLAVFNVLFYLDKRRSALLLRLLFLVANAALSLASMAAGPLFYGYGFALAVLLTAAVGLRCLSRALERLEYDTFMLQAVDQ
ncbi:MAG: exopolysaccharide Pel transporter PelG [Janthinobacterium lividum]